MTEAGKHAGSEARDEAGELLSDTGTSVSIAIASTQKPHFTVGIGASAGGLTAYRAFFEAMPTDSGMAFVLVQHLDPDFDSTLAEIIGRSTTMPVLQAVDGTVAAPNTVSVIPPGVLLRIENGVLRVATPPSIAARRSSIDVFLISLAEDQGDHAVGIILSGFGSDGTAGIGAIKEAGGLTLSEAEFDHHAKLGMPRSAVDGGHVDDILAVEDIPAALIKHQQFRARHVLEPVLDDVPVSKKPQHLAAIFSALRARTGRDVSQYRSSTLIRRIQRRMQLLRIDDMGEYAAQLSTIKDEPQRLFQEILISVTRFFRDAAIFDIIADKILPAIVGGNAEVPVRVWVAGCATGEEAYSIAMLLHEGCARAGSPRRVSIFATDVDERAITFARAGLYSEAIEADVTRDRLDQHFIKEGSLYRVAKHIREMCVFSTHDLIRDPPFSKLDLISCRNLLIYFEPALQQRVVETFHYGLNAGGTLWLGPSETISGNALLFRAVDKRACIFSRKDTSARSRPSVLAEPNIRAAAVAVSPALDKIDEEAARVMARHAPAYVVLDARLEIQRFSGSVARYLAPTEGRATLSVSQMLLGPLRAPARALVQRALATQSRAQELVTFEAAGDADAVNLIAEPISANFAGQPFVVLAFQETSPGPVKPLDARGQPDTSSELAAAQAHLEAVTEQLETANEELQSSNEEFQSVNEELHSTIEELETSKEELQSINEELQSVNTELNERAESLIRSNSDLANLFDSTSIATLFVDGQHRIRRYTPAAADIFSLRAGDEGRPLSDIATRLAGGAPIGDVEVVLRELASVEREIDTLDGAATYLMRMRPYRDLKDVIDGVVITLIDITERKRLERDQAHLAAIVDSSEDAIIGHDLDGIINSWNHGAQKIFGYEASEIIGEPMTTLLADHQLDEWPSAMDRLRQGMPTTNFDISRVTKDDRVIHVSLTISAIRDPAGKIVGASAVARDIAERKAAEERANLLMAELDHRVKNILAVISSVVGQTLRAGGSVAEKSAEVDGRIQAIARAHSLLTGPGGTDGSLRDLVTLELAPYQQGTNIDIVGEDVALTSRASMTIGLAIHELATNAVKYGSLSTDRGQLAVAWSITDVSGRANLRIDWRETGGPPVTAPSGRGFGTKLIELALRRSLAAIVDREFLETGVTCTIVVPFTKGIGRTLPSTDE